MVLRSKRWRRKGMLSSPLDHKVVSRENNFPHPGVWPTSVAVVKPRLNLFAAYAPKHVVFSFPIYQVNMTVYAALNRESLAYKRDDRVKGRLYE